MLVFPLSAMEIGVALLWKKKCSRIFYSFENLDPTMFCEL
jgi:hypothetical protein